MSSVKITPSVGSLARALDRSGLESITEARKYIYKLGLTVENYAKKLTPIDTGKLRQNITTTTQSGGDIVTVGTRNLNYARFVHEGVRPHWIGHAVKINRVGWRYIGMHPGMRARPFMTEALNIVLRRAGDGEDLAKGIDKVFAENFRKL